MQAIILAGGKGERLGPLTQEVPKPIILLGQEPFCHYQIGLLKTYGIKDIIFSVGYLREKIQGLLGDGDKLGVRIRYAIEDNPLGTAGAIKKSSQFLEKDSQFLVLNGDVLTDMSLTKLIEFHNQKKAQVTISLIRAIDKRSFGHVDVDNDGKIKEFCEKTETLSGSDFINAGIYVMETKVLDEIPPGITYSFEKDFIPSLIKKSLPVYGFKASCYWLDIGEPHRYKQAQKDISIYFKNNK